MARLRLLAVLLVVALLPATARAQTGAWSGCRTDSLATFNCASYYTGTVTRAAELTTPSGTEKSLITANVTAGRVSCTVAVTGKPEWSGRGMLAVEHDNTENAGSYELRVWCPTEPGQKVGRRDDPGIEVLQQESANYGRLVGKDSYEHPESDEANGVRGTVTVTWRLERR